MDPRSQPDPLVVGTVAQVRDRFGVDGLRDLVALATAELRHAERALDGLGQPPSTPMREPQADPAEADTQTWKAFVDGEHH